MLQCTEQENIEVQLLKAGCNPLVPGHDAKATARISLQSRTEVPVPMTRRALTEVKNTPFGNRADKNKLRQMAFETPSHRVALGDVKNVALSAKSRIKIESVRSHLPSLQLEHRKTEHALAKFHNNRQALAPKSASEEAVMNLMTEVPPIDLRRNRRISTEGTVNALGERLDAFEQRFSVFSDGDEQFDPFFKPSERLSQYSAVEIGRMMVPRCREMTFNPEDVLKRTAFDEMIEKSLDEFGAQMMDLPD